MSDEKTTRITALLTQSRDGSKEAASELLPLVYDELRKLAQRRLQYLPVGQTLQATALVHEAYVRLIGKNDPGWDGRGHFFAAAAQSMRNIVVERARRRGRIKHGGGRRQVEFEDELLQLEDSGVDILALDEALKKLESLDPRKAEVVTLRYFSGMTIDEIAQLYNVSSRTVEREWRFTRAWLQKELGETGAAPNDLNAADRD